MELTYTKFFDPIPAAEKGVELANMHVAAQFAAQAKALAPVDFGQLRNAIMYRTSVVEGGFNERGGGSTSIRKSKKAKGNATAEKKIDARPRKGEAFVGINLDHAIYQEFGTRFQAPQPYLRPAIAIYVYGRAAKDVAEDIDKEMKLGVLKGGQTRVKFY